MQTRYVDTHCHLDRFDAAERATILTNAAAAGVTEIVTIGTRLSASDAVISIAQAGADGARIWCTVGTHPEYVDEEPIATVEMIVKRAVERVVIGIGETGLDYTSLIAARESQRISFRRHIEAARLVGVPVIIHAREADNDVAELLRGEWVRAPFKFVLHCFSSGEELARTAVELGGYISFSGILTFPKAATLRAIAHALPRERLLIETDAPFLAPVPRRGRRNEPAYVVHTARALGQILGESPETVGNLVVANFRRLFAKAF